MAEVSEGRVRRKHDLGQQRNDCGGCAKDRKEWRDLVHMQLNEFHAPIFACPCVLSDRSRALVVIT